MRERLARAISGAPFPSKAAYRKAEAVLDELMTPTEGMEDAGEAITISCIPSDVPDASILFTAMIKAAKEGK